MSAIQGVLVDFGGVLYRTPGSRQLKFWLRLLGIRDMNLVALLQTSPLESRFVSDIYTGQKMEHEVWEELCKTWRIRPSTLRWLRKSSYSARRLNKGLIDYLSNLRPNRPTAILTNAGTDFRNTFCSAYALDQLVDQVIISAEESLCKPDPRLYQLAAQRMGLAPQEIVFVDDLQENVDAARGVGMQSFMFTSEQDTIQRIQSYFASAA